jgi:MFS family permease
MRRIPRPLWLLVIGGVANSLGIGFVWSLTAIYVHNILGQSMTLAGLVLTVQAGAGLAGSFLGGILFDRFGARAPLLASVGTGVACMLWMAGERSFLAYAVGASCAGLAMGVVFPCLNALAGALWPEGGRHAFNLVYLAENVGVAIGPLMAGLVATVNFSLTFLTGAILLLLFWAVVWGGYRGPGFQRRPSVSSGQEDCAPAPTRAGMGPAVWLLALGFVLNWVAYSQWITTTPTYMHQKGLALPLYSALWSINGGLILLGQPLVLWVVRRWPRVKTQILIGNVLFLASFAVLALSQAYPADVGAMVLSTLGEMFVFPGVPAAADQEVPESRRGTAQGLVSMAGFVGRMVGPVLGGALFSAVSPAGLYLVMLGSMALGGTVYLGYDRVGRTGGAGLFPVT